MVIDDERFFVSATMSVIRLIMVICIGLGVAGAVCANSVMQSAPTTITPSPKSVGLAMPSFLQGVELGMSPESLLRAREQLRGAKISLIRVSDRDRLEAVEGSRFVDDILYVYSGASTPTLELVAAVKEGKGGQIKGSIKGFVKGAVALWGSSYSVHIGLMSHLGQRQYEAISLLWKIDGKLVACTFPSPSHTTDGEVFGLVLRIVVDRGRLQSFRFLDRPTELDPPAVKREVADLLKEDNGSLELLR